MSAVLARLFGEMKFTTAEGDEFKFASRKTRALLAYLLVENDRWQPREKLAGLLWGDRGTKQARNSLNQALYEIRKAEIDVGIDLIERESERVRLIGSNVECDLYRFKDLLASDPIAANGFTVDEFLADLGVSDAEFIDWMNRVRTKLRDDQLASLRRQSADAISNNRADSAITITRRMLELDPLDEPARRQLMELYVESGNRAEAMRQYQICKELLAAELGVTPDPLTESLLERIKTVDVEQHPLATPESIERQVMVAQRGDDQAPVLAVLPFTNLSDDPEHACLAEGLADDLIHALSAYRWFKVLGRSSTFRVSEGAADLDLMRQSFGATHLVSGQLRRSGKALRINVELVDCRSGQQLWSARYNEPVERLFELEDAIVSHIASAVVPALEVAEMLSLHPRPPDSLSAYELLQRGNWQLYRNLTNTDADDEAARCYEAALAIDPNYAAALAALAYVKFRVSLRNATDADRFRTHLEDVRATAMQALDIDPREPRALRYLGGALSLLRDQEGALQAIERAIELCPSFATAYSGLAFVHDFRGEFAAAKPAADETMRLRPHDPVLHRCIMSKSIADYQTGAYEAAAQVARNSLSTSRTWWMSNALLAASIGQQGRSGEAVEAIKRIRTNYPGVKLDGLLDGMPFVDQSHLEHLREGLIKAGWRDES